MKPLENVWSGLVQRRLLPVALLLVAALAAIPFVLAKDPEPAAPVSPAADKGATAGAAVADPVVALAEAGGEVKQRRRVLGASKNPFEPGPAPKGAAAEDADGTTITTPTTGDEEGDKPLGSDAGGTGGAPSVPDAPVSTPETPAVPAPTGTGPKPTYEVYSLTVRFGDATGDSLERFNLPRLKPLPSADDPILVYLGPGKGAKTAIFMVDEGVVPQGDGVCRPSPSNCETIHMRPGDTEFFDVEDEEGNVSAQYQLDLLKIRKSTTGDASKAAATRAKESKSGRRVLRARQSALGPLRYRYDTKSGTVRKIGKRTYKALLAKSARVALSTAGGF
jgi:hypothetical protein